jgi:hypothetical protein
MGRDIRIIDARAPAIIGASRRRVKWRLAGRGCGCGMRDTTPQESTRPAALGIITL